jgi:hypothetical protein
MPGKQTGGSQEIYHRDMAWLHQCELFIAEVSGSSLGLEFETGYILGSSQKKVVLFYRRDLEERVSLLMRGDSHANCTLAPHADPHDVDKLIPSLFKGGGRHESAHHRTRRLPSGQGDLDAPYFQRKRVGPWPRPWQCLVELERRKQPPSAVTSLRTRRTTNQGRTVSDIRSFWKRLK